MKKVIGLSLVLLLAIYLTGCGPSSQYLEGGKLKQTIESTNVEGRYIIGFGIGAAPKDSTDLTQRRASSRNAAIVAAQYELVSRIKGVRIEGGVTIEKAMETDSKIKATVDDVIKGAEIIKQEWTNDDGCVVTLRIDKEELAKQLGVKLEK
jgi:hypothetical protein